MLKSHLASSVPMAQLQMRKTHHAQEVTSMAQRVSAAWQSAKQSRSDEICQFCAKNRRPNPNGRTQGSRDPSGTPSFNACRKAFFPAGIVVAQR